MNTEFEKEPVNSDPEPGGSGSGRIAEWSAIIFILILPFLVYLPVTTGYATFAGFDHTGINQPLKQAAFDSLRSGNIPLWEHQLDRGLPLYAEGESGLFYPLNILFLIPADFLTIYNLVLLLCLSTAGLLFYWWIRRMGIGWAASMIAAVAFQWSSTVNFNKANMNILEGFILTPLLMLLIEPFGNNSDTRDRPLSRTAGIAGVFAVMIFAGQSQYVVYAGIFGSVYIIVRTIFAGKSGWKQTLISMGLPFLPGAILGAGLAAVQLLPTLELIPLSERGVHSLYEDMAIRGLWLSPDRMFATYIFPAYHHSLNHFLPYLSTTVYVGPIAILLAGYAIRFRHRISGPTARLIIPLMVTGLIFLYLAMGDNAPLAGWLTSQGPLGSFRGHGRLGGYFAMTIILLMGIGLDIFIKTPCRQSCDMVGRQKCRPLFIVELPLMILLAIPFIIQRADYLETRVSTGLFIGMVLIFLTALLVGNLLRSRTPVVAAVVIVLAMQIIGFQATSSETLLVRKNWDTDRADLLYISENSRDTDEAAMIAVRTQASVRIHGEIVQRGLAALEGGSHNHIDHLGSANAGMMEGLLVCNADLPLENGRWEWLVHRILWPKLDGVSEQLDRTGIAMLDRLGINWVVTENPDLVINDWERVGDPGFMNGEIPYYIYRRMALVGDGEPYYYYAPKHSVYWSWMVPDTPADESAVRDEYVDLLGSTEYLTSVLIEGLEQGSEPAETGEGRPRRSARTTLAEWKSPTEYSVVVSELTHTAIFVLRDQWYPGWTVTVNGEQTELLRADMVFKAVKLEPGRNEIVFTYRSTYLGTGWAISGVSLLILLGLVIFDRRLKKNA